jgi:hypothetical protein
MEDAAKSAEVKATTKREKRPLWVRFIHYSIRQARKRKAQKHPEPAADKAARRTANATIAIAALTLVLAVVSYFQWKEIHEGSTDTHNLAESALAASRAWVVVQGTGFGLTQDKNFPSGRVVLADSGKSPAFDLEGWRCVEVRADEPPLENGILQKSNSAICLPISGGTLGEGVPIIMNGFVPAVPPAGFAKDTVGIGPHFYFWGVVTYDIYPSDGKRHTTSFCLFNGGDQLSACKEGGYQTD